MNVATRHIEGMTKIPASAGATPTRSIVIPLLPADGSWVIRGVVQAVRADGQYGPVTFFPQFTGGCVRGIATLNNTGKVPTQPLDGGEEKLFHPAGISLTGAKDEGLQIEIALTGVPGVAICWAWALEVFALETP
jgi:hypothetical protein